MTTIYADFNALTEDRSIRLTTRGSKDDLERNHVQIGDWVLLSDGEMQVEAQIANDPRYGVIGVPTWASLVDLEAETMQSNPQEHAEKQAPESLVR